jgi:hypothetical protein
MTIRRKVAAGLGGMTLLLGTLGGAVAVGATSNHATTPPAASVQTGQPGQPDAETADGPDATNGQDAQGASGAQDLPEAGDTPDATGAAGQDTNNDQNGPGQEVEDGGTDMPVTTTP